MKKKVFFSLALAAFMLTSQSFKSPAFAETTSKERNCPSCWEYCEKRGYSNEKCTTKCAKYCGGEVVKEVETKDEVKAKKAAETKIEKVKAEAEKAAYKVKAKIQKIETVQKKQQKREEFTNRHAERLQNIFINNYQEHLNNVVSRVDSKLQAMKKDGKDISAAETKLAEAQTKLDAAQVLAEKSIDQFEALDADNYEAQKEAALAAKDVALKARDAYKEVVKTLREVIKLAQKA